MKTKTLLTLCGLYCMTVQAQRTETLLEKDWSFSRDKTEWKSVRVPHDWAISGPFDKKWDLQTVAIEEDGETKKTEKSGRSGALPWIGRGYYRRTVTIPKGTERAELYFEGAMAEPVVTVNGCEAGRWAYGYSEFRVDITPLMHEGDNVVEVSVENIEESTRWYPGAGLYRPVHLILTRKAYIDDWSVFFRTLSIDDGKAEVALDGSFVPADGKNYRVENILLDSHGKTVAADMAKSDSGFTCRMTVDRPMLWSPEAPNLYTLVTRLYLGKRLMDETRRKVGIRTARFTKEGGFMLNGQSRKIKGVCLHHDLGPLGTAVNKAALARQLHMMKNMGCDAIRTSHNPPSQWQMQLCDSLGLMVMCEAFDMWVTPKCKNGYVRLFNEWSDIDLERMICANRNHPSIIMWSIGNEIREQASRRGVEIMRHLQELCHRLDPTRQVTCGMNRSDGAMKSGFAAGLDVPGFNYGVRKYGRQIADLPQGFLLGSETASTVSSRGVYKFPVRENTRHWHADGQCSSYDLEQPGWGELPDDDWQHQDDEAFVTGEFVWTGFDYLGEPTPYNEYWPSRSSYFGICDLAGLPKDRYWLYRSKWNTKEHTVHLLPHWTWPGRDGEVTPVYCYTDGVEAELFVNGKSQGRIHKNRESRLDRYRLRWNDVRYEPGLIEVVAYDESGKEIGRDCRRTAGDAVRICSRADRTELTADGNDMAFITVWLEDRNGTMLPCASDLLSFTVTGAGSFQAVCNGDATSLVSFTQPQMHLFNGQLVVIVRAKEQAGEIVLTINDKEKNLKTSLTLAGK
ncbi:MAG: glycoside hydrolase family 2 TIM barrel-domain containing protein [Prevotella sp.]|nr:glycoside hydrolase family 2 TIM barrel-domain containing protein [Prevotella sp.]